MRTALFILALLYSLLSLAQGKDSSDQHRPEAKEMPYYVLDQQPEFPGGEAALINFISQNLTYSQGDIECEGTVVIGFVVSEDGTLTGFTVKKSLCPSYDREAMRVVKLFPKFIPGRMNGLPKKAFFVLPIRFRLADK